MLDLIIHNICFKTGAIILRVVTLGTYPKYIQGGPFFGPMELLTSLVGMLFWIGVSFVTYPRLLSLLVA